LAVSILIRCIAVTPESPESGIMRRERSQPLFEFFGS
jgi:hypothetical protein